LLLLLALAAGCNGGTLAQSAPRPGETAPGRADALGSDAREGFQKVIDNLDAILYVAESGLLTALYAQTICSCHFADGLSEDFCIELARIQVTDFLIEPTIDPSGVVTARGRITGPLFEGRVPPIDHPATAVYDFAHPRLGCHLVSTR
jgi:hypothetical protein